MNVLDLFSGIGGFSLGFERAGMRTVAFCEIEPYCRAVLRKHWPDVPCYDDVRNLTAERLRADGIAVDVVCGGFPCQDLSHAGKGAGLGGERSGLWSEIARLVGELQPRYVIVENVSALLGRGLGRVLGDLAALGYDAEWHCIPASAVGAPHRRDRIWIVACPARVLAGRPEQRAERERAGAGGQRESAMAHPDEPRLERWLRAELRQRAGQRAARAGGASVPDAEGERCFGIGVGQAPAGRGGPQELRPHISRTWLAEPDVGRVAHGVPSRVDRLRALGNAVVPQIPEIIGRAIMAHE